MSILRHIWWLLTGAGVTPCPRCGTLLKWDPETFQAREYWQSFAKPGTPKGEQ